MRSKSFIFIEWNDFERAELNRFQPLNVSERSENPHPLFLLKIISDQPQSQRLIVTVLQSYKKTVDSQ